MTERTPISSLVGQKIKEIRYDVTQGYQIINSRGKVIATFTSHDWTLYDSHGNYFHLDV